MDRSRTMPAAAHDSAASRPIHLPRHRRRPILTFGILVWSSLLAVVLPFSQPEPSIDRLVELVSERPDASFSPSGVLVLKPRGGELLDVARGTLERLAS